MTMRKARRQMPAQAGLPGEESGEAAMAHGSVEARRPRHETESKHWRRGTTAYQELLALGASSDVAAQVVAHVRRWWHNSGMLLNSVLNLAWADRLGIPRLS
jgi:hypothetical protein